MLIRGKTLDLLILSMLLEQKEPLTGYSIAKVIEKQFSPFASPSPGTIYPRLKKLELNGDIKSSEDNGYSITNQGRALIESSVKGIVDNAFQSWSIIYKSFIENLSFPRKYQIMDKFGDFYQFNIKTLKSCCHASDDMSSEELHASQKSLEQMKQEIQTKSTATIAQIDQTLAQIQEILEKKQEARKKPTIIWEDDDT